MLAGKWFHSYDKSGGFCLQGQVEGFLKKTSRTIYAGCDERDPRCDHVLVQLYNWPDGVKTGRKVKSIRKIHTEKWSFYDTAKEMRHAYYNKAGTSQSDIDSQEKAISAGGLEG